MKTAFQITKNSLSLTLVVMAFASEAQDLTIPLWKGTPVGSENWMNKEATIVNPRDSDRVIFNVIEPNLLVFIPDKNIANGTAVIIAPGGAFRLLSYDNEGTRVAEWFKQRGVAAFVLKYRVQNLPPAPPGTRQGPPPGNNNQPNLPNNIGPPPTVRPEMAAAWQLADEDGRQAIRIVRQRAKEFNIVADKIGFMGFSAGAMVAFHMGIHNDKESRPDFLGLIYLPVKDTIVPKDAPPMFALSATDDRLVGNASVLQYQAWRTAGIPTELHVYDKGGHGFGMRKQNLPVDSWIERLGDWLISLNFLPKIEVNKQTVSNKSGQ